MSALKMGLKADFGRKDGIAWALPVATMMAAVVAVTTAMAAVVAVTAVMAAVVAVTAVMAAVVAMAATVIAVAAAVAAVIAVATAVAAAVIAVAAAVAKAMLVGLCRCFFADQFKVFDGNGVGGSLGRGQTKSQGGGRSDNAQDGFQLLHIHLQK